MPRTSRPLVEVLLATALLLCAAGHARAALSASATISTSQTSAPFDYTITLNNTGTTNIGTFWFAWTATPASYDFLPSVPSNVSAPAGWYAPITHNAFPGDGYGIEWYNLFGSSIPPGGSQAFSFTSVDSPTALSGPAFFPGNNVTTSFVYIGLPQTDPGFRFDVQVVPEPVVGLLVLPALFIVIRSMRLPATVTYLPAAG